MPWKISKRQKARPKSVKANIELITMGYGLNAIDLYISHSSLIWAMVW